MARRPQDPLLMLVEVRDCVHHLPARLVREEVQLLSQGKALLLANPAQLKMAV